MEELGPDTIAVMRTLKRSLDPQYVHLPLPVAYLLVLTNGSFLMNPGKVFEPWDQS